MAKPDTQAKDQVALTRPGRFLVRMSVFLIFVLIVVGLLRAPIIDAFLANPVLNALIGAALITGIVYIYRQVSLIGSEVRWMENFAAAPDAKSKKSAPPANLLAPMAAMMREGHEPRTLSAVSTRSILDSVAARLDEARDISRYMIGLLVFLGLLGTFWGLLQTISAVGDTINSLSVGTGDAAQMFDDLKAGLAAPLEGMGTAFSSSLFGLAGSLVLGFLDLQAGSAQNRFFNELEEWLSARTTLSAGSTTVTVEGDSAGVAPSSYLSALLEQTADNINELQRTLGRTEERRADADRTLAVLAEKIALLTDRLESERSSGDAPLYDIKTLLERILAQGQSGGGGLDDTARRHLVNIDTQMGRLTEELAQGRADALADLRGDIKLLTRTVAQMADGSRGPEG